MARSPSYPSISLEKAISLTEMIYEGAQRAQIAAETAFQLMGFKGKSGSSLSALAAVKHFGLVEGRGESLQVTDLAMRILNPLDDAEKRQAVREAGLSPDLFQQLFSEFGAQLPAKSVIRAIAVRKHGFSEAGAESVADTYLETVRYLEQVGALSGPGYRSGPQLPALVSDGSGEASPRHRDGAMAREPESEEGPIEELELRVSKDVKASIRLAGPVTGKDVERLIEILTVLKSSYANDG
jgi:hypothetical protein